MVMDVPAQVIFNHIGHEGMTIWWPNESGAAQHRGVHFQEVLDYAMDNDWAMIPIHRRAMLAPNRDVEPKLAMNGSTMIENWMMLLSGVIIHAPVSGPGAAHAQAWDHGTYKLYDPRGTIIDDTSITTLADSCHMFVAFTKMAEYEPPYYA